MAAGNRHEAQAIRNWARKTVGSNLGVEPLAIVEAVAAAVAQAISGRPHRSWDRADFSFDPDPPGGWDNVWLPGVVHEQAVSVEARSARGAWYTPESVVRGLLRLATADDIAPGFAADPTCGGGAFLLAALDRLAELGIEPADAVTRVAGLDIDPGAAQVSRWSIELWALAHGVAVGPDQIDVSVGDALAAFPDHWPSAALLVGNPPFATPLRTGAVPPEVAAFRRDREHLLGPYTDLAAMHLLGAVEKSSAGAVVVLVQPQSVLAGRDSAALRDHCDEVAPIHGMWAAREPLFDAGVRACAAVLRPRSAPPDRVRLASGPEVMVDSDEPYRRASWAGYAARALGAPPLPEALTAAVESSGEGNSVGRVNGSHQGGAGRARLGSMVTATAGFRDEYYGLVAACAEWDGDRGAEPNRLLTVGSVEPLATKWGTDPCRFGRKSWLRPWIDVDRLDQKVQAWSQRQARPKVVLATQSRILEPVIDRTGSLIPATPLIAVHGEAEDLNLVAAVLLAPPVVAWAAQRWFGAALAVDALKLAAKQVLELPLPVDRDAWERAAALIGRSPTESPIEGWRTGSEVAAIMNQAYGADDSVLVWWQRRGEGVRGRRPETTAS